MYFVAAVWKVFVFRASAKKKGYAIVMAACDDKTHACFTSSSSSNDPYLIVTIPHALATIFSATGAIFFAVVLKSDDLAAEPIPTSITSFDDVDLGQYTQHLINILSDSPLLGLNLYFHVSGWIVIDHLSRPWLVFYALQFTIVIRLVGHVLTSRYPRASNVVIRPI